MIRLMSSDFPFFRSCVFGIILFQFSILLVSCSKENIVAPPSDEINNEYMSLHVGDLRQYFSPYSGNPNIYSVWKVTGKTQRSDGTEVFVSKWYTGNYLIQNERTEYNFIRDNFYYVTQLDSTSKYPGNPFFEQKLAEVNPHEGDIWQQINGYINPDSSTYYIIANHMDAFYTPAGKFNDVYRFVFYQNIVGSDSLNIFYANNFGYVGTMFPGDTSSLFVINYANINGKEVGNYVKMDSTSISVTRITPEKTKFGNPMGKK